MARIYGLNGLIRGRQGNNVFSIQNGTQVVKVYNPAVSNPRTIGQREQRSKLALAGKMSAATPSGAIIGMRGGNNRSRRADFVANIIKNSTISTADGSLQAAVAYSDIKFSVGSLSLYSNIPSSITAAWGTGLGSSSVIATVPVGTLFSNAPAGYGELVIACAFDARTSQLDEVQVQRRVFTSPNTFYFRFSERRDLRVVVYFVPFASTARAIAMGVSNLFDSETSVNVIANITDGASLLDFGESVLGAVVPVLGSSQNNAAPAQSGIRDVVEAALLETAVAEEKKIK